MYAPGADLCSLSPAGWKSPPHRAFAWITAWITAQITAAGAPLAARSKYSAPGKPFSLLQIQPSWEWH
jgi:hypothetical protein